MSFNEFALIAVDIQEGFMNDAIIEAYPKLQENILNYLHFAVKLELILFI